MGSAELSLLLQRKPSSTLLMKDASMRRISSAISSALINASGSPTPMRREYSNCVPTSAAEAYAIRRNRDTSFGVRRPHPSAILLGTERDARRSCDVSPYCSVGGNASVKR